MMQQREHRLAFVSSLENIPMYADRHRIGQVLDHLLRNAYSFTLPGGDVQVEVSASLDRAVIAVADTGVGIDEDEIEKVFERLYRGRSADAGPTDSRGLGLGLYLSQRIIEAHQGTILLKSQPNQGTTIIIGLPLRQQVEAQPQSNIMEKIGQY
jgi:signal transduction histidine kinase